MKSSTYTLNGIKTFRGRNGFGLNANLLWEGTKVARILDEGNGGEMRIDWLGSCRAGSNALEATFMLFAREQYERDGGNAGYLARMKAFGLQHLADTGLRDDRSKAEHWINAYADREQIRVKLRRWCKTKTVFGLLDEPGQYHTLTAPYSPAGEQFIRRKYADRVKFIVNPCDDTSIEAALL